MSLPTRTRLDSATTSDIVRRIVDAVAPERIIVFGSAARDRMGPHSDVDLLIVKRAPSKREVTLAVRRALRGIPEAFDIIVATPEELERYRDSFALVYRTALEEGNSSMPPERLPADDPREWSADGVVAPLPEYDGAYALHLVNLVRERVEAWSWPADRQGRPFYPAGFEELAGKLEEPLHPPGRDVRCIVSVGMPQDPGRGSEPA